MRLLRAGVLLGAMVFIPGVAVFWNLLPKPFSSASFAESFQTVSEPETTEEYVLDNAEEMVEREPPILQAAPFRTEHEHPEWNPMLDAARMPLSSAELAPIKAMNWEAESETKTILIPTVLEESDGPPISPPLSTVPSPGIAPQRSFPILEDELQALGATRYRLEKWGNRGELFRFSCYVTSTEPYNFQKLFQEIDSDEIRAMERVITKIKVWRKQ